MLLPHLSVILRGIQSEGIGDGQLLPGEGEMEVQQQIQKLVIGILGDPSQEGRDLSVAVREDRVFAHIGADEAVRHRCGVGRPQHEAVLSVIAADQTIVACVGGDIDRRASRSHQFGQREGVRIPLTVKAGGADEASSFIQGDGEIMGGIEHLAECLKILHF